MKIDWKEFIKCMLMQTFIVIMWMGFKMSEITGIHLFAMAFLLGLLFPRFWNRYIGIIYIKVDEDGHK